MSTSTANAFIQNNIVKPVNSAMNTMGNAMNAPIVAMNKAMNAPTNSFFSAPPASANAPAASIANNAALKSLNSALEATNNGMNKGFNMFNQNVKKNVESVVTNTNLGTNMNKGPNANANKGSNANANANVWNTNSGDKNTNLFSSNTNTNTVTKDSGISWGLFFGILVVLIIIFTVCFVFFSKQIMDGYDSIRKLFIPTPPPPPPPTPEQPAPPSAKEKGKTTASSILEKVLPPSSTQVFNVNKNDYNFYDAEPLCRALGAELATYDQVKDAYSKGADWCNYGWVKGQMAVYPTQKVTYEDLQKGPEDERGACGKPGVNGGYFDNPEMKFGVNCYGPKPVQSAHDLEHLSKNGRVPMTAATLKIDQQVNKFKAQADTIGVLPFNKNAWTE